MVAFDSKTYSKRLLHLISWSHWFTFFNIIAAILLSSVYLLSEKSPDTFVGAIYLLTTWLSHMGFITFMAFVLTVFPLTLIYPKTKFIRTSASIIFTGILLLLLFDAFTYSRLGYHINASSFPQIIELISQEISEQKRQFWFVSILLLAGILSFELIASNYAWKHLQQLQKTVFARYIIAGLIASFFISHLTHIWADANLKYDVLRHDNVLPVSYPTTAKALLTKYDLFNEKDYLQQKNSSLSFNNAIPQYPNINELTDQCAATDVTQSTLLILTKQDITKAQSRQIKNRSSARAISLNYHVDSALSDDAWFNLMYGLPTIYQENIKKQNIKPLLFQEIEKRELVTTLYIIGELPNPNNDTTDTEQVPVWFESLFEKTIRLADTSTLLFEDTLKNFATGLYVIYFADDNPYQFELFMDALLLAQRDKSEKAHHDNIWVSSIGNETSDSAFFIKPALLIWPTSNISEIDYLTNQMDISATLLRSWLHCPKSIKKYYNGRDLFRLNKDRVIANTLDGGVIVFNKDKSIFVDNLGNFKSYSRQLQKPITIKADIPLMIDGMQFIKKFTNDDRRDNSD